MVGMQSVRNGIWLGVSCFVLWTGAGASGQTLDETIRRALPQTVAYKIEAERFAAAKQAIATARAAGLPDITLAGSTQTGDGTFDLGPNGEALFERLSSSLESPMPSTGAEGGVLGDFGNASTHQAALTVVQPLFSGFRIKNGKAEARATVSAAKAQFEAQRQVIGFDIARTYMAVLAADARTQSVAKSQESLTQRARAANVSFEAGRGTRTDLALAEARLAGVRARFADATAQAAQARNQYRALVGVTPEAFVLDETIPVLPGSADEAVATARQVNPRLKAVEFLADARAAAERSARGQRAPSLQVKGTLSYAENRFFAGDRSENATIAAELSMPIFKGGTIGASVRRAAAEAREARFVATDTARQVEADVRDAFVQFQAARIAREATASAVAAAELAFRGVSLEQEVGQRTVLDVLQVEDDLLTARFDNVEAQRAYVLAAYQLRLAMGTLLVADE
ncbi:MAG: TolC family protein [Pseudomonadota bacterium]